MPSFLPGLSQWLQHQELPYGVLVFPWFVWYELKASEARQVKRIEELQADMKESSAQARNEVKASEARQEKRIDELRADLKTSEARQREDVADLKADDRALKRGSGPDGMPAPPATPSVTFNISMQPSPTRGIAGQPSKPATAPTHPPIERAVSVCETAPPASASLGGAADAPAPAEEPTTPAKAVLDLLGIQLYRDGPALTTPEITDWLHARGVAITSPQVQATLDNLLQQERILKEGSGYRAATDLPVLAPVGAAGSLNLTLVSGGEGVDWNRSEVVILTDPPWGDGPDVAITLPPCPLTEEELTQWWISKGTEWFDEQLRNHCRDWLQTHWQPDQSRCEQAFIQDCFPSPRDRFDGDLLKKIFQEEWQAAAMGLIPLRARQRPSP